MARAARNLLVAGLLAAIAICSLPESGLRRALTGRAAPALNALGVDQRWDLFAPDPRRVSIGLVGRVTFADGSQEHWQPPERDALAGAYSDYRWRKLAERAIVRGGDRRLARSIAAWLLRERPGAVHVQLVARLAPLGPPGSEAPAESEWTLVELEAAPR